MKDKLPRALGPNGVPLWDRRLDGDPPQKTTRTTVFITERKITPFPSHPDLFQPNPPPPPEPVPEPKPKPKKRKPVPKKKRAPRRKRKIKNPYLRKKMTDEEKMRLEYDTQDYRGRCQRCRGQWSGVPKGRRPISCPMCGTNLCRWCYQNWSCMEMLVTHEEEICMDAEDPMHFTDIDCLSKEHYQ